MNRNSEGYDAAVKAIKDKGIPKLPPARLLELADKIRPVVSRDGKLFNIKPCDISGSSYLWDVKTTREAKDLKPLKKIRTLHTYGYYGFFKPSIEEVLCQIDEADLESVVAFQITDSPQTASDLNKNLPELDAGFHVAETTLYTR